MTANDGSDVAPACNSAVLSDGGSDGVPGDGPAAEGGGDLDTVTSELLRRWLKCGNSGVASFELLMQRLTSPDEPLACVASELVQRALSCFGSDTELLVFGCVAEQRRIRCNSL